MGLRDVRDYKVSSTAGRLASGTYGALPQIPTTWLTPEGTLDEAALLEAFRVFLTTAKDTTPSGRRGVLVRA